MRNSPASVSPRMSEAPQGSQLVGGSGLQIAPGDKIKQDARSVKPVQSVRWNLMQSARYIICQRAHACMRVLHLAIGKQAPALPKGGWSTSPAPAAAEQPQPHAELTANHAQQHNPCANIRRWHSSCGAPSSSPSTARPRACRHRRRPPQSAAAAQHGRQASAQPPRPTRLRRGARRRS